MKWYYSAAVCDYDEYSAKEFINYISSQDRLKGFETALQCAENAKNLSLDIVDKAKFFCKKARDRYGWHQSEEHFYANKARDIQARLKNIDPLHRYPRRGLDGNIMTDNYGNVQYIIEPNPDYIMTKNELEDVVKKRDEHALEKEISNGAIDYADALISKYSLLAEVATKVVEEIINEQRRFLDEMQTIIQKVNNAMNAAARAYSVDIKQRVSTKYLDIPYIKRG